MVAASTTEFSALVGTVKVFEHTLEALAARATPTAVFGHVHAQMVPKGPAFAKHLAANRTLQLSAALCSCHPLLSLALTRICVHPFVLV